MAKSYDIYFKGEIMPGADLSEVKANIGRIFNADASQLAYLFAGERVKIKDSVDQETAVKYRVAFRNAGALVAIAACETAATSPQAPSSPAPNDAEDEAMTLLPPNTGSLIDCAPAIQPAPLPDIRDITLAKPGSVLDETPATPKAEIDTSELELFPANSGTLEDCRVEKEPAPIPDISQLKIVEDR